MASYYIEIPPPGTVNGVTSVGASSPLSSTGGTTPNITIQVATSSQNGYLSSTDFNIFNNKVSDAQIYYHFPVTGGVTENDIVMNATNSMTGIAPLIFTLAINNDTQYYEQLYGVAKNVSGGFADIYLGWGSVVDGFSFGANVGLEYYIDPASPGKLTYIPPVGQVNAIKIGRALSATQLVLNVYSQKIHFKGDLYTSAGNGYEAALAVGADGYILKADSAALTGQSWESTGNLTDAGTDGIVITGGTGAVIGTGTTISQHVADTTHNGYLSSTDWNTFNGKADLNSPAFTGIPTAPTAGVGTSTTQLATTAFVLSQGFTGATGSMPFAHQSSTTVVTSATTTYVTAISTTITTTASSAPVYAKATGTFTVTGAVPTVLKYRISINGVAGQEQLLSLTAITTNYTAAVQYISAALGPGTYTVLFEMARNSGTGTTSFFEGTLDAIALQGTSSNGITQLTGDITAGPGSGSQVATIPAGTITNAKINAAAAIAFSKLAALPSTNILVGSAGNVATAVAMSGDATLSNAGVLTIANLAITNAKIANATINLTTKVTGTLPVANGGTGLTAAFAAGRVMFSNGSTLAADALFTYTTANTRFFVGQGGGTGRINGTVSTADPTPNDVAGNFFSRATANGCVNIQNENTLPTIDMTNSGGTGVGANILAEASRGTLPARTQSQSGDTLFSLTAHGRTASAWSAGFAATISVVTTEAVTDTTNGGEVVISTTITGGTTPAERVRVKNSGETVFQGAIATARLTTAAKNALTPVGGWVVFDTTLNQLSYYNGTTWVNL